jgi:hypothetical protein
MMITKTFSLTNFLIGSSALCFQIFVLYPWHEKLDAEFGVLKKEHARLLDETHQRQKDELKNIREYLQELKEMKEEKEKGKGGKFW